MYQPGVKSARPSNTNFERSPLIDQVASFDTILPVYQLEFLKIRKKNMLEIKRASVQKARLNSHS
jgi:hypothetical protein